MACHFELLISVCLTQQPGSLGIICVGTGPCILKNVSVRREDGRWAAHVCVMDEAQDVRAASTTHFSCVLMWMMASW